LRPDQYQIAKNPAKTKVLSMGRRWGKTVLGGAIVGLVLAEHGKTAWIAPTYKNTRPMWRWLLQATAEDVRKGRIRISRSDRTLETKRGGFLGLYSGDNIDSIRGEAFHYVVLDEAARLPEEAWTDAIMPTLADYDGSALLISTPKGKNWFWREWMIGSNDAPLN
jgi:phage terminase large subunit-like protein